MAGERRVTVGRQREVRVVGEYAGEPAFVLVRGRAEIGKTTLLGDVDQLWRTVGTTVVQLRYSETVPSWDAFGVSAVVSALRKNFHEFGGPRIAAVLAAASRKATADAYASAPARSALFGELVRLFRSLRSGRALAVLVDDLHLAPDPLSAVAAARQAGCTVVATCLDDTGAVPVLSAEADRVLDLLPLADGRIGELFAVAAGGPLDQAVTPCLVSQLGPLAGIPGVVLATFEKLKQEGRLVKVDDFLCLRDPGLPVALPAGHFPLRGIVRFGELGEQLLSLVATTARFGIDDLPVFAEVARLEVAECGHAVDGLVEAGVLVSDEDGRLRLPCPALAAAVRADTAEMAALHRAIAEHLRTGGGDLAAVADHLALAGSSSPPNPDLVPVLVGAAERVCRADPLRAARWYWAALRHARQGEDGPRILSAVVRSLIRFGHYRYLAAVVADAVAAGVEARQRSELAAAAVLAAMHLGVPVPEPVRAAFPGDPALEFAAAWFAGRVPVSAAAVVSGFTAFDLKCPSEAEQVEAIKAAEDRADPVALFQLLLGDAYGVPDHGPLALHRQLVQDYYDGNWSGVVSAARQLELAGVPDTAPRQIARLFAAEVLSAQGDGRGAARWLERTRTDRLYPVMRVWTEMGVAYRGGEWDVARERGWAGYATLAVGGEVPPGLRWFLCRLAYLEHQSANAGSLRDVCADVERWYRCRGGLDLRLTELMLRGMVERDTDAAIEMVETLRKGGDPSELLCACVIVAFSAEHPEPWYLEAYEIARRLGGERIRARIEASMVDAGLAPPRPRESRDQLTVAEKRIVGLIGQGMTNRQIAAVAGVSEKTVENHLTRVFAKTGLRSRLDVATACVEGRLLDDDQTRDGGRGGH